MVNDTFSAKRFGKYFKYDLKQLWHNNGKAAIALGFISVICYIVWVAFSLIFTGVWQAPGLTARLVFFVVGSLILVMYQTRTYGYLTEKKAGQLWLMVPASTLEKYASMMIITIFVIPLAYVVSYLALDSLIGLFDNTSGGPLVSGFGTRRVPVQYPRFHHSGCLSVYFQSPVLPFLRPLLQEVEDYGRPGYHAGCGSRDNSRPLLPCLQILDSGPFGQ